MARADRVSQLAQRLAGLREGADDDIRQLIEDAIAVLENLTVQNEALEEAKQMLAAELEARVNERTAELKAALEELERERTERERVEQAEREFVSNAAHQLRNPLAAIRGAIEVLQAGAKDDPGARDRFLDHIERESARLTRLAHALLLLARAQAKVEDPRRQVVQLAPLLYSLAGRFNPPDGVSVEVRCALDLAAVSNAELLEEALTCLADNAVRYTQQGRILLSADMDNSESVTIEVRDDGPGIPEEVQARMFDRFAQAGQNGEAGFGLGLAIAAQAARAIGADLEITSAPGRGTRAQIRVPAARVLSA